MHHLAVIGNPVAHSLSPQIFTAFAAEFDIDLVYDRICPAIEDFESVVLEFFASGGYALNITAPFKTRAYDLADVRLANSQLSKTANVLIKREGKLVADNTDGRGLVADLIKNNIVLNDQNILLIGSGSVIHSVLAEVSANNPNSIDILMRNPKKITDFSQHVNKLGCFNQSVNYDLIINTTPNINDNQLFAQINKLKDNVLIYDMDYKSQQTLFIKQMQQINPNIRYLNGLGMLIMQAKFGFEVMFGKVPQTDYLYKLLGDKLHG